MQPVPRDWLIPLINAAAAVSLAGIGIGGLAIILGYLERLLRLEVPLQAALLVTLGGLLGFFMVIGFISQQLFRSLHKPQAASQPEPRFAEAEPQAARLNSAEAAAASVTEHTTRHLEGELCKR
ncbi:MAG: hypothetical protein HYR56_03820 [Acidobacteria bacterium]|nr:hypothetical protein [Acidobacteriota bacterium]